MPTRELLVLVLLIVVISGLSVVANALRLPGTATAMYGPLKGWRVGCVTCGLVVGSLGTLFAAVGIILGLVFESWVLFWISLIVAVVGWAVWMTQFERTPWWGD